jgi:hypothetical protein
MSELDALRVREEVLQAMYWMRAEGIADTASAAELARFLAVPAATLAAYLERFAADGWLDASGDRYGLSERGLEEGRRAFADEFADMTRQGHGECDEDCWCHESPEEAARCLEERAGQHAGH